MIVKFNDSFYNLNMNSIKNQNVESPKPRVFTGIKPPQLKPLKVGLLNPEEIFKQIRESK